MGNTKISLLIMLIIVIFTLSTSLQTTKTTNLNNAAINVTDQDDKEFTDFKERKLPLVEETAEKRIKPISLAKLFYFIAVPIFLLAISVCLIVSL